MRRHRRVRRKVFGTSERPRLVVHRSNKNIQGHVVDDVQGRVLVGASSMAADLDRFKDEDGTWTKRARSHAAGLLLAERAKAAGITAVVFDRGGYIYHGRVAAFAEGAREGGLEF